MLFRSSGAYSSIFIAAPLLTIWKEREPEYVKRKAYTPGEDGTTPPEDGGAPARRRPKRPKGGPALDPGVVALRDSERALADEKTPGLLDLTPEPAGASAQARRDKRRQRRRTRPHGRAR